MYRFSEKFSGHTNKNKKHIIHEKMFQTFHSTHNWKKVFTFNFLYERSGMRSEQKKLVFWLMVFYMLTHLPIKMIGMLEK